MPEDKTEKARVARRDFLRLCGVAAAGLVSLGLPAEVQAVWVPRSYPQQDIPVGPLEALMCEHGVLGRLLLIYEETRRRLIRGRDVHPEVLLGACRLVRLFIEDCHVRLEEDFVFPRLEEAGLHADLTRALRVQHQIGRRLTDRINGLAASDLLRSPANRRQLGRLLAAYVTMLRPHMAYEETGLFPAFHKRLFMAEDFETLGERFQERERQSLGGNGFEKGVAEVVQMENALGLYGLTGYNPASL